MATIVYLDVDDEITSAAARIRTTKEKRVALVVPGGSRLATSRINFRLLAREAQTRDRRLAIVAGDAATRALAASAGLPVFGSVGEYEEAQDQAPDGGQNGKAATAKPEAKGKAGKAPTKASAHPEDLEATAIVATGVAAGARGGATTTPIDTTAPAPPRPDADAEPRRGSSSIPVAKPRRTLPFGRTTAIVAAAVLAFVVLVGGVAGYLLLPSAKVSVTAREQPIGPVSLTIRADPAATAVDPAAGIVPAERLSFDLIATDTFASTGVRVETAPATGQVRFQSKDPTGTNDIPAGSQVSTSGGVRFRTQAAVTIPRATIVGLTIIPGEVMVGIRAVSPGPQGNVEPNAITVIPQGEDPLLTSVTNPDATRGGRREEFPLVQQADVDAALAKLTEQLGADFATILADPTSVPEGKTMFPGTRVLPTPEPTVAPESLVGTEAESFELGLTATGTVVAVDESPLQEIARTRIRDRVETGHRLVDDSIVVGPADATVEGEIVTFTLTATAAQVRVLDAADLRALVKGKPLAEARTILAPYGEVEISAWPDWVTTIPTIDARFQLTVATDTGSRPRPSSTPRGSGAPTGAPSGSRAPTGSASPAP